MDNLEPIEIEFLINNPELLADLQAAGKGFKDLDVVIANTQKKFEEYRKTQGEAGNSTETFKGKVGDLGREVLKTGGDVGKIGDLVKDFATDIVTSSVNVGTLTKAKELWSAVNLRVATTLGISTAAAQALTATLTLGLSVVIVGLVALVNKWRNDTEKLAESQKQFAETVSSMAADSIASYMALQAQWNALGNDLQAKQKFVEDNQKAFTELGVSVDDVTAAENVFNMAADAMVASLMARATAMAATQAAAEELKKSLLAQDELNRNNQRYDNAAWGKAGRAIGRFFGEVSEEDVKRHQDNATNIIKIGQQMGEKQKQILQNSNIKIAKTESEAEKERKKLEAKIEKEKEAAAKKQQAAAEAAAKKAAAASKRARDKESREAEAEARKAKQIYDRKLKDKENFISKIAELENRQKNKKTSDSSEEAKIKSFYDELRNDAKRNGLNNSSVLGRIKTMENNDLLSAAYKEETNRKIKALDVQKQMYAAYETFKTQVGKTEAGKRFDDLIKEFGTYQDYLQNEIDKFSGKTLNADEHDRLKQLQDEKAKATADDIQNESKKYADALNATLTFEEKKAAIEEDFINQKSLLEKNYNGSYLAEKLRILEQQKTASIASVSEETLQNTEAYRRLGYATLQMNRQQLQERIAALKTYLATAKNLTPEQKTKIENSIKDAENLEGKSRLHTYILQLEQRRKLLIDLQNEALEKQSEAYADIALQIEQTNREIAAAPYQEIADKARDISSIFGDLSNAIGDSNAGLADTLSTIGTLAGAVSDVAGGIAEGILSGNPLKAIGGVIKGITKIFSLQKAARESEKKAQEELKKYHESIFQSQLDYNAELRKRIADEVKLNDIYKSRVTNIKEEMAANAKNKEKILADQQTIFNRLLKSQTVIGMHTEKYGGFLGFGRKTKAVEDTKSVAELLGIGSSGTQSIKLGFMNLKVPQWMTGTAQMTDEIFEKLEKLNAEKPLTGDAKTAYEQLKKLRDEYGSIADAQRELEKQLKDAITGTTAQSIADSIRQGVASGKKTFADFADDIEGFLRDAILAGMETDLFKEKIQGLQDELATMMGDGVITAEERAQFQQMYLAIVDETKAQMEMLNQAGVKMGQLNGGQNSLQGAMRAASQESIDLMGGQLGGMRLAQLETRDILKAGAAQQLAATSKMIELQIDIEKNTRRTADNTEKLKDIDESNKSIDKTIKTQYNDLKAAGIIK